MLLGETQQSEQGRRWIPIADVREYLDLIKIHDPEQRLEFFELVQVLERVFWSARNDERKAQSKGKR